MIIGHNFISVHRCHFCIGVTFSDYGLYFNPLQSGAAFVYTFPLPSGAAFVCSYTRALGGCK